MTCKKELLVFLLCLFYFAPSLKAQSCCDIDGEIKLCYLSASDYCAPEAEVCPAYSLDGSFMTGGLNLKLQSADNFGPNGILDCNLVLKKLPIIQDINTITDCNCDMVFVPIVQDGSSNPTEPSFIPIPILETIYDWSVLCKQNLVIVFQEETEIWGYELKNGNNNPHSPVESSLSDLIFNGPFGQVTSITQGGSFQGFFSEYPSTGSEILVAGANGAMTVGLDIATNDIVVGDIDMFCTSSIGQVSSGAGIANDNDRFVLNLFALGCRIAMSGELIYERIEACPSELVTLPNGEIVSEYGDYIDTLLTFDGCDSLIRTIEVIEKIIEPTDVFYEGCSGDNFSIIVNDILYNESNPLGQELLLSPEGCDSTILIDLFFSEPDVSINIESQVKLVDCTLSPFKNTIPDGYTISWTYPQNLDCPTCPNPIITSGSETVYTLSITDEFGCSWNFDIDVSYHGDIYIPNIFSPNQDGVNDNFSIGLSSFIEEGRPFNVKIFDRWGSQVFSSNDPAFQWNGKLHNRAVPTGVYTYWIDFNCKQYKGSVTLVR